jgi:hypothetical protein
LIIGRDNALASRGRADYAQRRAPFSGERLQQIPAINDNRIAVVYSCEYHGT